MHLGDVPGGARSGGRTLCGRGPGRDLGMVRIGAWPTGDTCCPGTLWVGSKRPLCKTCYRVHRGGRRRASTARLILLSPRPSPGPDQPNPVASAPAARSRPPSQA